MLYKSLASTVADVSLKDGVVTHDWSAFGNRDSDGDIIVKGAYAKTIAERGPAGANRIKFLWQHDVWEPIGAPRELFETDDTLRAVTKVAPTQRGRDALILYEEQVLNEHSVGIDVLRRDEQDQARILEVRLWEGSVVTWGANPLTPYLGMKAEKGDAAWKRVRAQLDAARKALKRPLTDETAEQLELWLNVHEQHLNGLRKAVLAPELVIGDDGRATPESLQRLAAFVAAYAPTDDTPTPPAPGTSGDGAPRDEAEALELLINAL